MSEAFGEPVVKTGGALYLDLDSGSSPLSADTTLDTHATIDIGLSLPQHQSSEHGDAASQVGQYAPCYSPSGLHASNSQDVKDSEQDLHGEVVIHE